MKINPYKTIIKRRYWPQLVMTLLIPMFQQLTGINAIMFYAPQLFQAAGQGADAALLSTVITGVSGSYSYSYSNWLSKKRASGSWGL